MHLVCTLLHASPSHSGHREQWMAGAQKWGFRLKPHDFYMPGFGEVLSPIKTCWSQTWACHHCKVQCSDFLRKKKGGPGTSSLKLVKDPPLLSYISVPPDRLCHLCRPHWRKPEKYILYIAHRDSVITGHSGGAQHFGNNRYIWTINAGI